MSGSPQPSRRILVVAADENFSGTIGRILCRCGYTIDRVSSGKPRCRRSRTMATIWS